MSMPLQAVRRVMITGGPGSGKSTLARAVGARLGVPVFHLDRLYHRPGWVPTPREEFAAEVARVAALPAWVIDGNYTGTMTSRLTAADLLVLLLVPRRRRMWRVLRRTLRDHGKQRPDAADGCPEQFDSVFLRYAWRWDRDTAPGMRAIAASFGGRVEIICGQAGIDSLLAAL